MKKKVFLKRIFHRNQWRLALFFDYDETLKAVVQSIPGCSFSISKRCYYFNDTEEKLRIILSTLRDSAHVDISAVTRKISLHEADQHQLIDPDSLKIMPMNTDNGTESDLETCHPVTITVVEGTIENNRIDRQIKEKNEESGPVEFRISERDGLVVIKFQGRYDRSWIDELLTYDRCRYDRRNREWLLPWSKITVDSLADYFSSLGVRVNVVKQQVNPVLQEERKESADRIRQKDLGQEALEGLKIMSSYLDENRYSRRTKESYIALLEFYFRYFSPKSPDEISKNEISGFISDHVLKLGYSPSYQNQMVSAIKMYYQLAGRGRVNPELLERPRRTRALPKVLSKGEVSSILNSARNIKHKLLLWMIYSCGLRRSEVTNIRLRDLDRERSILHIRQGKGGVDRIVPLSPMVWARIDEYRESYRPVEYLFEGQTGGRYSAESVYRVFKDAMQRAGIVKDVGVHSLRHSYATHLHEKGLDIRYIQELLGHKSARTTEIYTHVSRRNLMQVRSPIEDLDVK